MFPLLCDLGTVKAGPFEWRVAVGSYGVMLALAIVTVALLLQRELVRKQIDPDITSPLLAATVAGGIVGARIFYLLQHGAFSLGGLISCNGLVWYGGLIGGSLPGLYVLRRSRAPLLPTLDALGPLLMLGYAIARIGCFLAGDGDYGPPSDLPWAMAFPNGTVPTTERVHPTPLYETAISTAAFALLWKIRLRKEHLAGWLFGSYLLLSGAERFAAEFWRINPPVLFGLSVAQHVSLLLALLGSVLVLRAAPPAASASLSG